MDFTKLGPLLTGAGTSLIGGGVVAVPKAAPVWVQGVLVVIGVVMVALGQYLSHQTIKDVKAVQDDHAEQIAVGAAIDKATGNNLIPSLNPVPVQPIIAIAMNPSPQGSLVSAIQPNKPVPPTNP